MMTAKQARYILGFESFVVKTFTLANSMSVFEEKMQRILFNGLGYNTVRYPGAGPDFSGVV